MSDQTGSINSSLRLQLDLILLLTTIILAIIGIAFIYSSGIDSEGIQNSNEYMRQLVWTGLGIIILVAVSFIKYDIYRDISVYIYLGLIVLLLGTLVFGHKVNGARSWLGIGAFGIQPSEFMKIASILVLARFIDLNQKRIHELKYFTLSLLIVAAPMAIILVQPDLGTTIVYLPIALFMLYIGGARSAHLIYFVSILILGIIFTIIPAWHNSQGASPGSLASILINDTVILIILVISGVIFAFSVVSFLLLKKRYFYWIGFISSIILFGLGFGRLARFVLEDYQLDRLIIFIDPYVDKLGAGWNIINSIIAVGSGGIGGKGFLQGTQSHLRFLPEQSTDFIFSILSEEWGFLGGILVFSLYSLIIARGLIIIKKSKDLFGALIASGIVAMIALHLFINIGMAIGIMPIMGIPLMFLSYGGSNLLTGMAAIGILSSIGYNRYKY